MSQTVAICLVVAVISVCITLLAITWERRKSRGGTTTSYGLIEAVKELGDIVALSVHANEIVTVALPDRWYERGGKMLIICGFDIEYRFNLKRCEFSRKGTEPLLILPPQHVKISTDIIHIYDEQKGVIAWIFPKEIPLAEKNNLILQARAEATKRALSLNQGWLEKAQHSARNTLEFIARGMKSPIPVIEFMPSSNVETQVADALKGMTV